MELVILGASGFIGSAITAEALSRGHTVTAVVNRPERIAAKAGLTVVGLDINDTAALTRLLSGKAIVISAFSGHAQQDVKGYYLQAFNSVLSAATAGNVGRLLVVGFAEKVIPTTLPPLSVLVAVKLFPEKEGGVKVPVL